MINQAKLLCKAIFYWFDLKWSSCLSIRNHNFKYRLKGRKTFVFFNTIISFIAKYRSRIKSNLDIVIKMSNLIKANGREILNADLRLEDIQKLVKWSKLMTCQDAIDEVVFKSPSGTFLQYVQLLVKQVKLKRELK